MKKIIKKAIAGIMAGVMLCMTPFANIAPGSFHVTEKASAADSAIYISEVKVGMGETESEAKKELEAEGYTILKDSSGAKADLNNGAGSKSALKRGANDKIVYLGYKTTSDPSEAITDLAVMNMNGGYSIEDYNILMERQMESQIKPFVNRFISTLEEYRANYKKSKKTKNYIRANYMRKLLNKLTDDDTGGQPIGDLLLNKTKYEMGDAAYNKLSDAEKKNHADILTLLMQANGTATLTMETLLTKAADTSTKDTWVDRFRAMTLDDLTTQIKKEDKSLTTRKDINNALDKKYKDTAAALLKKWDSFREEIMEYEDTADELQDSVEETGESVDEIKDIDFEEVSGEELADSMDEYVEAYSDTTDQMHDTGVVAVGAYLESVEYDDGTLFDFFTQDKSEVSGSTNIRKLYPIVEALTSGQIAGLDFVSFLDLFQLALADENTYKDVEDVTDDIEKTSIYENVDREIYKKGGVALTNDALRAKASAAEKEPENYKPSTLTTVLWISTAGFAAATVASSIVAKAMTGIPTAVKNIPSAYKVIWNSADELTDVYNGLSKLVNSRSVTVGWANLGTEPIKEAMDKIKTRLSELDNVEPANFSSSISGKLAIGFAVVTVIITVVTTAMTIMEAMDFYDTEYIPIPNYMVEEKDITAYNEKGEKIMIKNQSAYYKVVKCNRTAGKSDITKKNYETMGDNNDLNGDIGTQWLALYAVRYEYGNPILASSLLYMKGDESAPKGYSTGIHEFGGKAACNLNKKVYLFADEPPVIKVYYKNEKKTASELNSERQADNKPASSGSIYAEGFRFSLGSFAIGGGTGLILGCVFVVMFMRRKKKLA